MATVSYFVFAGQGLIAGGVVDDDYLLEDADPDLGLKASVYLSYIYNHALGIATDATNGPFTSTSYLTQNSNTNQSGSDLTVTGATAANPIVITTSAVHGLTTADKVYIKNVGGLVEANTINDATNAGRTPFSVTVLTTTTFSIAVDGSLGSAYTSAGTVHKIASGRLFGPDIGIVPKAIGAWTLAGMAKYESADRIVNSSAGTGRWDDQYSSEAWDQLEIARASIDAAIVAGSNTPVFKGFILSFGYVEAAAGSSATGTFKTELSDLITAFRAQSYATSTTPVVLEMLPAITSNYDTAQIAIVRAAISQIAAVDDNISAVEWGDLNRTAGVIFPTGSSEVLLGERLFDSLQALNAGVPAAGNGRATVVYLGHSQAVGAVNSLYIDRGDNPNYNGGNPLNLTYHHVNGTWPVIDAAAATSNSNTFDGHTDNFGPDVALVDYLQQNVYTSGMMIFKSAVNSSSIADTAAAGGVWNKAADTLYSQSLTAWGIAKSAATDTGTGLVPDVRAIVLHFGENSINNTSATFEADLTTLIANARADYSTRTDGSVLDVYIILLRFNLVFYPTKSAEMTVIRNAMIEVARKDAHVHTVETNDLTPLDSDDLHYSGQSIHECGIRVGEAIKAVEALA